MNSFAVKNPLPSQSRESKAFLKENEGCLSILYLSDSTIDSASISFLNNLLNYSLVSYPKSQLAFLLSRSSLKMLSIGNSKFENSQKPIFPSLS